MAGDLYNKLLSLSLLRRSWHLARSDSRGDFMIDAYRYEDFAFWLEDNLKIILTALERGDYHPRPLLKIDVPKSSLAVRPGSVLDIEDRIVLFAITCLIAPILDKKLPETVYSYRLKEKFDRDELFKDRELLEFPFLKRRTIERQIPLFEPWYGQWPLFDKEARFAFEGENFRYLSVSDISAYFENINLDVLRDILLRYLPREQRLINLLISILNYWVYRTPDGRLIGRGIPQGNSISSFLANIYLLPLDEAFMTFGKKYDIRYFRYMDDVKIFSKAETTARRVIFLMNEVLRSLHLNLQGAKTVILRDKDIQKELYDERMDRLNELIEKLHGRALTSEELRDYRHKLRIVGRRLRTRERPLTGKDLRTFRRLITGYSLLRDSGLAERVLREFKRNPDFRLIQKAVRYFQLFPNKEAVGKKLAEFLGSPENLFELQEAMTIQALRYMGRYPKTAFAHSQKVLSLKRKHWYVRAQSSLLLSSKQLKPGLVNSLRKVFEREEDFQVRRGMIAPLCQMSDEQQRQFLRRIIFDPSSAISRRARMLLHLREEEEAGLRGIDLIFHTRDEIRILDSLDKLEVLKNSRHTKVLGELVNRLQDVQKKIRRPELRSRIASILEDTKQRLADIQLKLPLAPRLKR